MYDVTRVRRHPSERQPSMGFRCEVAVGGDYLGMYQKEHPTGSLHQIMLGWPGGRVAGWPGGRVAGWPGGRAMRLCVAQGGGWLCVPASPPESSASIVNSFRSSAARVGAEGKGRRRAWGAPACTDGRAGASKGAPPHAQWFDANRTPGLMTGSTANGSLERSGAMGLPMGRDES